MRKILIILQLGLFLYSCCGPDKITNKSTSAREVYAGTSFDSVRADFRPQIVYLRDTIIQIKPYAAVIDTTIQGDEVRTDKGKTVRIRKDYRVKAAYNVTGDTAEKFNIEIVSRPDSIFRTEILETDQTTVFQERPWYELPLFGLSCAISFAGGAFYYKFKKKD